jgi:hypothetical protein
VCVTRSFNYNLLPCVSADEVGSFKFCKKFIVLRDLFSAGFAFKKGASSFISKAHSDWGRRGRRGGGGPTPKKTTGKVSRASRDNGGGGGGSLSAHLPLKMYQLVFGEGREMREGRKEGREEGRHVGC